MYRVSNPHTRAGRYIKFGLSISIVALVAACSSSSERFGENETTNDPGHNPNGDNSVYTGSLNNNPSDNGDFNRDVAAQPLNDPTRPQQADYPINDQPGGNTIVVRRGETVYSISRQTGASVPDLIAINNLQPPHELKTGQSLVLPAGKRRTHVAQNTPADQTITPASAIVQTTVPGTHRVKQGQTLYSIARAYGHTPKTVAAHNRIDDPTAIKVGQALHIPARDQMVSANYTPPTNKTVKPQSPAKLQTPTKPVVTTTPVPTPTAKTPAAPAKNPTVPKMTSSKFRWPVKGRVISEFGSKPSGGRNDGINVAVPEGTSVKAAENGVVAYAGNELKGYGNLVLIRHQNNWVTAYAHNKELFVRRGDTIKRGQIIAKAGKTGSVTTPQLHFEIRKGAQAVDPRKYLSPNSVASN